MSEIVSSSDFQSKVLDAQGPVLVDFFATWCGPCKMLAPTLDEVAAETAGKAAVSRPRSPAGPRSTSSTSTRAPTSPSATAS